MPAVAASSPVSGGVLLQRIFDLSQRTGQFIVEDSIIAVAVTNDSDGLTTTGVDLYENGVLVDSMSPSPVGTIRTWTLRVDRIQPGARTYVAKRNYSGGTKDSNPRTINVLDVLAPDKVTSWSLLGYFSVVNGVSIQMDPTLEKTSGSSDVTISSTSTLVGRTEQLTVQCTNGGSFANARVTVTVNGTDVLTDVDVDTNVDGHLDVPGTDLTLHFPSMTYSTSMIWRAVCSHYLDLVSSLYPSSPNNLDNATAGTGRPYIRIGTLGGPCVKLDGIDDMLKLVGSLVTQLSGTNKSFYFAQLVQITANPNPGATRTMMCASHSTDTHQQRIELLVDNITSPQRWGVTIRDDAGVVQSFKSSIPANTGAFLVEIMSDGSKLKVTINTADVIGGENPDVAGDVSAYTATLNQLSLGARTGQAGTSSFGAFEQYVAVFADKEPNAVERIQHQRWYNT